ncbi:hypothetical protein yc1106_03564 [Curvularia clavata]|uniref:Uncharacterized protein n=1 Tax=Curvularia clavata TaxID=95742 RepID=A0A9Q8Z5Z1_CURCL|nr:hypothetical protein yc1106_03564 [Curvularia clavata]
MSSSNEFEMETFSYSSRPLTISIPSNGLRLPVASPSPLFANVNEDINTEAFPAFDRFALPEEVSPPCPPLHCAFQCNKKVCRVQRQIQRRIKQALPPCTCLSDSSSNLSLESSSPLPVRPPLTFVALDGNRSRHQKLLRRKPLNSEIEIHLTEVQAYLEWLKVETIAQVLRSDAFMKVMRDAFPDHDIRMAVVAVEQFFDTMSLYFERTVPLAGSHTVVLEQLWMELDVYLWTAISDWIQRHYGRDESAHILGVNGPGCVEFLDSGAPAVVLGFWRELTKALVETLVWRDEEVKKRHGRTWMWLLLGSMLVLLVAYGN